MSAKLIRVEKNTKGISYLDTYYFECADCGKEYFRHTNNKRINPYCGPCQKKHDYEKQKERLKAKKNQGIIAELEKIKEEISGRCIFSISKIDVLDIIDKHIAELKGENK
ncbi:MAG: hypothetical protein J6R32_02440 [Bacteroidales bacterium]|nr:hypothetical protein [Bacteroidales bacterium]